MSLQHRLARILVAAGASTLALAQGTQTSNVVGQVLDRNGAPIVGAQVRLTSPALQGVKVANTDPEGRFALRLLPPGTYDVQVAKEGFSPTQFTQVLGLDQTYSPRITLTQAAEVVVSVDMPVVDRTAISTATHFRMEQLQTLPAGRTPEAAGLLTPGVVPGVGGNLQVNGGLSSSNLFLLDGQNLNDNAFNTRGVQIIEDAIEEIQVVTGALSAEYGSVDGGVFNALTRSGGNTFTGSLRWNLYNEHLDALRPMQDRAAVEDRWSSNLQATVGGYAVKDKLWFFFSGYRALDSDARAIGTSIPGPGGAGAAYTAQSRDYRLQGKVTWSPSPDHTLIAAYMRTEINSTGMDYGAGELRALGTQRETNSFFNATWRATLGASLTGELRFGRKLQHFLGGGEPSQGTPFQDFLNGKTYNNALFNRADGGVRRNNTTANGKLTWFGMGLGTHQIDAGFDLLRGTVQGRNDQSPTGMMVFNAVVEDLTHRAAVILANSYLRIYQTSDEAATQESLGVYLNDKWVPNAHLAVQVGLRYDRYQADSDRSDRIASAGALSPRLGLKYDLLADGRWIAGLSFSRYTAQVLPAILNRVTGAGNPGYFDHASALSADMIPAIATFDVWSQRHYWQAKPYSGYVPSLTTRINPNLKAPTADELQGSLIRTWRGNWGEGLLRAAYTHKTWNNLIDYRVGDQGSVQIPGLDRPAALTLWDNVEAAERRYRALEVEARFTRGGFQFTGHTTWASLKGNYQGESANRPGSGEGLGLVLQGLDIRDFHPDGFLQGHVPLRHRWTATYARDHRLGRTTTGFIYRYDAGARFDEARQTSYGRQVRNQVRGTGIFPSTWALDFSLTHEGSVFKVGGTPLRAFGQVTVTNVLNHQMMRAYSTGYLPAGDLNAPWVTEKEFGQPTSAAHFLGARSLTFSTGLRF